MAMGMTWKGYVGVSVAAFAVLAANAVATSYERGQTEEETAALVAAALLSTSISVFIVVNMAFCSLFLAGKLIQVLFFGRLRESETQHMQDRMLNYALFKIIFVSAILEPGVHQLVRWAAWFSILGFLKVFAQLSRDRFEYLMTSANTRISEHKRLVGLLLSIMVLDVVWFLFCLSSFPNPSYSVVFLLSFECFTLLLDTLQTLIKCGIHLARPDGNWENRGTYVYYTEFVTDSLILTATLCHYCHILYMHGFSFTLIDAVLFLNMRIVFNNLRDKVAAYRNYRKLAHAMNARFPSMTAEELEQLDDDCAICRERMTSAKRLPCKHVFHENCLRLWLEQHHSCPTCRLSLIEEGDGPAVAPAEGGAVPPAAEEARADQRPLFAAFLGQGGRAPAAQANWLHWLPGLGQQPVSPQMIEQVRGVLPDVPTEVIRTDLRRTGSVELTIANILEGRVHIPEALAPPEPQQPREAMTLAGRPAEVGGPAAEAEAVVTVPEPPKGFAATAEERSARLAARKAALRQQARQRLLDAQRRKAEAEAEAALEAPQVPQAEAERRPPSPAAAVGGAGQEAAQAETATEAATEAEATTMPSKAAAQAPSSPGARPAAAVESVEARRRKLALAAERRMRASSQALAHAEGEPEAPRALE